MCSVALIVAGGRSGCGGKRNGPQAVCLESVSCLGDFYIVLTCPNSLSKALSFSGSRYRHGFGVKGKTRNQHETSRRLGTNVNSQSQSFYVLSVSSLATGDTKDYQAKRVGLGGAGVYSPMSLRHITNIVHSLKCVTILRDAALHLLELLSHIF